MEIKTILVPVDFSEFMEKVMEYAGFFAQRFNSSLLVFHVLQTYQISEAVTWMETFLPPQPEKQLIDQLRDSAEQKLEELKNRYSKLQISITTRIEEGVPFVEIVRTASEENVDMILMGSHGRTGIKHLLIGSVAEKVIRKAPCPVFCVKSEEFRFQMV
jgi:nucleotide-binding universal stress UspA family protein